VGEFAGGMEGWAGAAAGSGGRKKYILLYYYETDLSWSNQRDSDKLFRFF
jgi:hypothetical protein